MRQMSPILGVTLVHPLRGRDTTLPHPELTFSPTQSSTRPPPKEAAAGHGPHKTLRFLDLHM